MLLEVSLVVPALFINDVFSYILFLLCTVSSLRRCGVRKRTLWEATTYSVILPDNYLTIALFSISSVLTLLSTKRKNRLASVKILIPGTALLLTALFSTVLNSVPAVNVFFALLYCAPAVLGLFILSRGGLSSEVGECFGAVSRVVRIELIATGVNFFLLLTGIKSKVDWSTGTLGGRQQAQLFLIFALYFVIVLYDFIKHKTAGNGVTVLIVGLAMISTECWTQLAMAIIFTAAAFALALHSSLRKKAVLSAVCLVFCVLIFYSPLMHDMKAQQAVRILTEREYRNYRAGKINTYLDTFFNIPRSDTGFFLLGNGLGWYASRGALTCTGKYVSGFNRFFGVSMSEYTARYIYPGLLRAYENGSGDYGSVLARPYSAIIAIMGELGIIGILLFFLALAGIASRYGPAARMLLVIWLSSCFVENYLEYAKVLVILLVGICWASRVFSKAFPKAFPKVFQYGYR